VKEREKTNRRDDERKYEREMNLRSKSVRTLPASCISRMIERGETRKKETMKDKRTKGLRRRIDEEEDC